MAGSKRRCVYGWHPQIRSPLPPAPAECLCTATPQGLHVHLLCQAVDAGAGCFFQPCGSPGLLPTLPLTCTPPVSSQLSSGSSAWVVSLTCNWPGAHVLSMHEAVFMESLQHAHVHRPGSIRPEEAAVGMAAWAQSTSAAATVSMQNTSHVTSVQVGAHPKMLQAQRLIGRVGHISGEGVTSLQ